mgnify:CR=1 FL=1
MDSLLGNSQYNVNTHGQKYYCCQTIMISAENVFCEKKNPGLKHRLLDGKFLMTKCADGNSADESCYAQPHDSFESYSFVSEMYAERKSQTQMVQKNANVHSRCTSLVHYIITSTQVDSIHNYLITHKPYAQTT